MSSASSLLVFPETVYKYACNYVKKQHISILFYINGSILYKYMCCSVPCFFLEYPGHDSISVQTVGLNHGQFCSPPRSWGHLALSGDFLLGCRNSERGCGQCYWHLVGRLQGCCQTSYNAQDRPPQQRIVQPQMSVVLKLWNPGLP